MAKRRPPGDGIVRKRDGRWEGRIVVGHNDNGDPSFRYVYGKTQKELLDKLHQSIECYRDVELNEDSRMTPGEWLDIWLDEHIAGTVRPSTLDGYRRYTNSYIKPVLGGKQISLITTMDIRKVYTKLKKEGCIREHPEHGYMLSDSMISRIHAMLHHAMKTAQRERLIVKNPTEGTVVPKANYKSKQILNEEQMDQFMAAVEQDEVWKDFFYTELTTGLRRGEICGLMWQDFDAEKGTLQIARTLHCKKRRVYHRRDENRKRRPHHHPAERHGGAPAQTKSGGAHRVDLPESHHARTSHSAANGTPSEFCKIRNELLEYKNPPKQRLLLTCRYVSPDKPDFHR